MKTMKEIEDVFTAYGEAAYNVQLMEYDIITIWMLDSVKQGVVVTRIELLNSQNYWSRKTFGQLLNPLRKSNRISQEIKDFLDQLRITRNRLAHNFFLDDAINLQTNIGRKHTVDELQRMSSLVEKGQQFFKDILTTYLNDFGIDAEAIRQQVLQKIEPDDV
jgi:hypothetical protein